VGKFWYADKAGVPQFPSATLTESQARFMSEFGAAVAAGYNACGDPGGVIDGYACDNELVGCQVIIGGQPYCLGSPVPFKQKFCTEPPDPNQTSYCDPSEEDLLLAEEWPEVGCVNLAQKGGKLVGSKYDPENDGSYSAPRSSIELCDDFGNSFELKPSASGGWKSISASNPGDGYLYNSKGEQIARISGSEFSDPNV
jgi:uncharacterized protein (DUF2147 family)